MSNTEKKKKNAIRNNMFWAFVSIGINYGINFFVTPYVTNNIGVDAYGYVSLANTFITYIDIIAVGLNSFAGRFISEAYYKGDLKGAKSYYASTVAGNAILSAIITIPCLLAIWKLNFWLHVPGTIYHDVQTLFILVFARYLFTLLRTALAASAFLKNRLDLTEKIQGGGYIVQAIVLIALCITPGAKVWYVGAAGLVAAIWIFVCSYLVKRRLTPELLFQKAYVSVKTIGEIVKTGIWSSINELGNVLNSGLDLIITEAMLSPEVLGQIAIAKQFSTVCAAIIGKICSSYRPQLLQYYASREKEQIKVTMIRGMKLCTLFCTLVISVFAACGKAFLQLWIPGQDIDFIFAASMIAIMGDILPGIVNPLYYSYTMAKKVKVPCFVTVGMGIANLASMYILIKTTHLGGYAVLFTTLVINMVHFIDAPLYSTYCLKMKWSTFYPMIFKCLTVSGLGIAGGLFASRFFPATISWIRLIALVFVTTVILGSVEFLLVFGKQGMWKIGNKK